MVSEGNDSTQGMFRTLGVAIALLLHEHLHLVRATLEIARSRFRFGQKIKNTSDELAKALAYLAESLLVITLAIKLRRGSGHLGLLPEFPLSEEIEPLIYSLFVIYIGIGGHWIACLFSKQRISPAATLAAYAYWYGFIQHYCQLCSICQITTPDYRGLWRLSSGYISFYLVLLASFYWYRSFFYSTGLHPFTRYRFSRRLPPIGSERWSRCCRSQQSGGRCIFPKFRSALGHRGASCWTGGMSDPADFATRQQRRQAELALSAKIDMLAASLNKLAANGGQ